MGLFSVDGYNCIRQDRAALSSDGNTKTGGGLCIYINSNLVFTEDKDLNVNSVDLELVTFTIIPSSCRRIRLLSLYRPPSGNLNLALEALTGIIDTSRNNGLRLDIILIGDINVDLLSSTSSSKAAKQFSQECGLTQIITSYTRAGIHRKTLLDHIYIDAVHISQCGTIDIGISDHLMIYLVKKKVSENNEKVEFLARDLRSYNKEFLADQLKLVNWGVFYAQFEVQSAWDIFINILQIIVDSICPYHTFKFRQKLPDWFTPDILELSANRDRFAKLGKRTKDPCYIELAGQYRNLLKDVISQSKYDYFRDLFQRYQHDSKNFWNAVKLWSGGKSSVAISRVINPSTGELCMPFETPNVINKFFAEIGTVLADAIPMASDPKTLSYDVPNGDPIFHITPEMVHKSLLDLESSKSSGCPILSTKIYLDLLPYLMQQLGFMFTLSLKTQRLPRQWKRGIVTPIPKKGNITMLDNLRPICITHIIGKVLEKFVANFIQSHFDYHQIICPLDFTQLCVIGWRIIWQNGNKLLNSMDYYQPQDLLDLVSRRAPCCSSYL